MRIPLFILFLFVTNYSYGERPATFAKTGRIVTVEQWGGRQATVWAVQKDRVVVYQVFDSGAPDKLLLEVPIQKEQFEAIEGEVVKISANVRGRVYYPRGWFDGIMLRISFTSDGRFADDRIEIQNLWMPWLDKPIQSLSTVLPEAVKPTFKKLIEDHSDKFPSGAQLPTVSVSVVDYYKVPEESVQPTSPKGK